jgi:hypothetical protein
MILQVPRRTLRTRSFATPRRSSSLGRGGLFGLRLSALYGPALGDWGSLGGSSATDGPALRLTGGYAALAFGFGRGETEAPILPSRPRTERRNIDGPGDAASD